MDVNVAERPSESMYEPKVHLDFHAFIQNPPRRLACCEDVAGCM
jgi:hypothetical protein